jgi:predicted O-methyltransferase YrrM
MLMRSIARFFSKKTLSPRAVPANLLDRLDDPFRSVLLSMYEGRPQVGADGQRHALDTAVKIPPDEGVWLYEECLRSKPQNTLEVGLGYGFSTLFFLAGLTKNGHGQHTAIDPYNRNRWHGIGITTATALAPAGRVRILEETSVQAAVTLEREGLTYDFIFIDGGHLYEQALVDFFLYAKLCTIGGLVVFDDMWMSSIKTVVSFVQTNRSDFAEIPTMISNLCVFRKTGNDDRKWYYFRPFVVDQNQIHVEES